MGHFQWPIQCSFIKKMAVGISLLQNRFLKWTVVIRRLPLGLLYAEGLALGRGRDWPARSVGGWLVLLALVLNYLAADCGRCGLRWRVGLPPRAPDDGDGGTPTTCSVAWRRLISEMTPRLESAPWPNDDGGSASVSLRRAQNLGAP